MINIPVLSFNAGELSPQIDARQDVKKYSSGCRTCENMIPRIYGSAERRPGTKYVASSKVSTEVAKLVSFSYSDTISYVLEFGDSYIRFYYDKAQLVGTTTTPAAWADDTAYVIGEFVTHAATVYRCLVAHTSVDDGAHDDPAANFTDWVEADLNSDSYPICETPTPYVESDIYELQFRQSADVMWIVHPDYPQRKLSRTSATTFDLSIINFTDGPFLTRNDLKEKDDTTITPSATTGDITLTASSATFNVQHATSPGALFKLTQARADTEEYGSHTAQAVPHLTCNPINVKGPFSFNTHGTWSKTIQLQRNVDSEGWEVYRTFLSRNTRNIQYTGDEKENNVQYRVITTASNSGVAQCDITVNTSTDYGIARVTSYISTTVVNATVIDTFPSTTASKRWAEGAWSAYQGYPSAFAFFEERGVYAGTTRQPQSVWFSASSEFDKFEQGTGDSDSFWITMSADKINPIRWASALEALVLGTKGGEWRIRATAFDETLTPTNFNARQQSSWGSMKLQPIPVGTAVLFVDSVGRKVREMTYTEEKQKFVAPDLSALAEHITLGGITCMAHQTNPDSILWVVLEDGELLSMSYERDQDVIAWAYHPIGGTSAVVESVAVIPGDDEDEIWLSISRTVDGSTVRYIELMQPRVDVDLEDSWYEDSALNFDGGSAVITAITAADPPQVTVSTWPEDADGNDIANGHQIYITGVEGMTEVNGNYYTIRNADSDALTFTLESV